MLDTRYNIGVTGKIVAGTPKKFQVTGTITTWTEANKTSTSRVVVPAGATAVLLNVTAVSPTSAGYLSIRPGNATGVPATAGLNFIPGDIVANAITVAVPTTGANAGKIDLYYGTPATKASMDVVIDIVGYTTNTGLLDLVNRVTALENEGVAGPAGPKGDAGPAGTNGTNGTNGVTGRNYGRTITSLTTVDTTGNVGDGWWTSIMVGADNNPIISYNDDNGHLKVTACTNPTCTTQTITTLDSTNSGGYFTSITVGADANPIISYYDNTTKDLKVAACTNPTCTAKTIFTVDDDNGGTGTVGWGTSITVGADNNPIISYRDNSKGHLKVAACTNANCSAAIITTVDNSANDVGEYSSITVGADANPIISYFDATNGDLKVAACINPTCTSPATITTVDNTGFVGAYSSITVGADANPIISYSGNNGALTLAACTNPTCTSPATITPVDITGIIVSGTSITVGADGNPIISYYDRTNKALKVAACINAACTGAATITTVDDVGNVGDDTSITIGADGSPIISYFDVAAGDLKVAKLTRTSWTPNTWES